MPTYVYRCRDCEVRTEVFQRITDDPLTSCESCGGAVARVLQPVGIVFKGSGFYTTDYKRSENSGGTSAAPTNGKSADAANGKSDAPKSESTTPKAEKKEPAGAAAAS
jgi:putative FmdB family regulatory protein